MSLHRDLPAKDVRCYGREGAVQAPVPFGSSLRERRTCPYKTGDVFRRKPRTQVDLLEFV